jgi:hypothetical protein
MEEKGVSFEITEAYKKGRTYLIEREEKDAE